MTALTAALAAAQILSAPLIQAETGTLPPHEIHGICTAQTDSTSAEIKWQDCPQGMCLCFESDTGRTVYTAEDADSFTAEGLMPDTGYTVRLYPIDTPFGEYMTLRLHTEKYTNTKDVLLNTPVWDQLSGNTAYYGCGPTCMGMLLKAEKGVSLTKDEILRAAYNSGNWYNVYTNFSNAWSSYAGATLEYVAGYAALYGYEGNYDLLTGLSDGQVITKINSLLDSGHRIILGHRRKESGAHHYAVIYGKTVNNGHSKFKVIDPYGGVEYTWSEDDLLERLNAVDMTNDFTRQVRGIAWLS